MHSLSVTEENVRHALEQVYDPELGVSIVDLGLIYDVAVDGPDVRVTMTMTTFGCPLHDMLTQAARQAIETSVPGVASVNVVVVWDPPWTPDRLTPGGHAALGW